MENKVYTISNPYFLSDTFVFKEHPSFGSVYVKLNGRGKIEEIGYNFPGRLFHAPINSIIELPDCKEADDKQIETLELIDDEYFGYIEYLHDSLEFFRN